MNEIPSSSNLEHVIVAIGVNAADISGDLLRDPRILFIGSRATEEIARQDHAQCIIWPNTLSRQRRKIIEAEVKKLRKDPGRDIRTVSVPNATTIEERIRGELLQIVDDTAARAEKTNNEYVLALALAPALATVPAISSIPASFPPPSERRMSQKEFILSVYESLGGDRARIREAFFRKYPHSTPGSFSTIFHAAKQEFLPAPAPVSPSAEASEPVKSVGLDAPDGKNLSEQLELIQKLLIRTADIVGIIIPIVAAIEEHEIQLAAVEASTKDLVAAENRTAAALRDVA